MPLKVLRKLSISIFCSVSFIILSYLIFRTNLPKFPNIIFYNLIIIMSLQEMGFYRGVFFLGCAVFLTILISLSLSFYYIWNVPLFFITFLIVDQQIKKHTYHTHITTARIEEIKENMNMLTQGYVKHQREAVYLEKKEARYSSLKDLITILSSSLSLDEVISLIVNNTFEIIGKSDGILLFLVDTQKQGLNLMASKFSRNGSEKIKEKQGGVIDEWVFKQRQGLIVEDIKKDFRFYSDALPKSSRDFRSVISCPLIINRKIKGVLRLESWKPHNYNSEDLRLLDVICDIGAVSLENAKLYQKTLELAIRDSLTGLYLRRHFLDRLKDEIARSFRNDAGCSFIMIDIDDFKTYNDQHGHIAGDIVLKVISKTITKIASNGIVGRYGGEEFGVILPEVDKDDAFKIAEAIRKGIKNEPILLRRVNTHVTVSLGVASFPEDAKDQQGLILKADERLYKAKREGKDRAISE